MIDNNFVLYTRTVKEKDVKKLNKKLKKSGLLDKNGFIDFSKAKKEDINE